MWNVAEGQFVFGKRGIEIDYADINSNFAKFNLSLNFKV